MTQDAPGQYGQYQRGIAVRTASEADAGERGGPGSHTFPAGVAPKARAARLLQRDDRIAGLDLVNSLQEWAAGTFPPATPLPESDQGAPSRLSGSPTSYRGTVPDGFRTAVVAADPASAVPRLLPTR